MRTAVLKSLCIMLGGSAGLLLLSSGYDWSVKNQKVSSFPFKFVTLNEILFPELISTQNPQSFLDTVVPKEFTSTDTLSTDSLSIEYNLETPAYVEGEMMPEDTVHNGTFLYNPKRGDKHALDNFFQELEKLEVLAPQNLKIRVAHYGDSQLEGGLITFDVRELLKKYFNGGGTGFIPFYEPCDNMFVTRKLIGNWKRYTCFHDKYSNSYYGFCGTVYRFMPARNSTFKPQLDAKAQTAQCIIDVYRPVHFQKLCLFWGKSKTPWKLRIFSKDSLIFSQDFEASDDFHVTEIPLKPKTKKFTMEFEAIESPDLYGFSLEPEAGLIVDNLALRGHSGNGFHLINTTYLKKQFDTLNHKLIILQFGGNIIPYTKVKSFKWYEDDLYKILLKLKKAAPNASILVISNMDMGFKGPQGIVSYPTAPKVRDAQKRASLRAGVAFLDLFELMGGIGAIVDWYHNRLALNDFAHLTPKGQKKIAEFIVQAIVNEYQNFKNYSAISNFQKLIN